MSWKDLLGWTDAMEKAYAQNGHNGQNPMDEGSSGHCVHSVLKVSNSEAPISGPASATTVVRDIPAHRPPTMPDASAMAAASEWAERIIANARARAAYVPEFRPVPWPQKVRCGDCRHFSRLPHPHLGVCTKDPSRHGVAGNCDTDKRICPVFEGRTSE